MTQSTPSEQNLFNLNIPDANQLYQQQNRQYLQQHQNILNKQKKIVEDSFANASTNLIEFDTTEPLLPEITQELTNKGYSYSYYYTNNNNRQTCHVVISYNNTPVLDPVLDQVREYMRSIRSRFFMPFQFRDHYLLN